MRCLPHEGSRDRQVRCCVPDLQSSDPRVPREVGFLRHRKSRVMTGKNRMREGDNERAEALTHIDPFSSL